MTDSSGSLWRGGGEYRYLYKEDGNRMPGRKAKEELHG